MRDLRGKTAVLTGAGGGLGSVIADALAVEGLNLVLVALPGPEMERVCARFRASQARFRAVAVDFRDADACTQVTSQAFQAFGQVDLLINNAGVEFTLPYHELTEAQINEVLAVNLAAPMHLTRQLLPGMLERRCGHIVNMSSLAAKSTPACQEPYAATKAALTAFTFSLRATYRGTGVSASALCPGLVDAGIYARIKAETGCTGPVLCPSIPPQRVARAVLRAIRHDSPEIILSRYPVRPVLMLHSLSPRLGLWLMRQMGVHDFFWRIVAARRRQSGASQSPTPIPPPPSV